MLELTGEQWQCDDQVLETLHYGLASRWMIAWSRSLSPIRKQLGFRDTDEQSEDLIDVGEDDGVEWKVTRLLTYRWTRGDDGRWSYRLRYVCLADVEDGGGDDG
jgi:hypothetical protein